MLQSAPAAAATGGMHAPAAQRSAGAIPRPTVARAAPLQPGRHPATWIPSNSRGHLGRRRRNGRAHQRPQSAKSSRPARPSRERVCLQRGLWQGRTQLTAGPYPARYEPRPEPHPRRRPALLVVASQRCPCCMVPVAGRDRLQQVLVAAPRRHHTDRHHHPGPLPRPRTRRGLRLQVRPARLPAPLVPTVCVGRRRCSAPCGWGVSRTMMCRMAGRHRSRVAAAMSRSRPRVRMSANGPGCRCSRPSSGCRPACAAWCW